MRLRGPRPGGAWTSRSIPMISSPLKRSTQTAALVGNEMGYEGKLQIEAALRPQGDFCRIPQSARQVCAAMKPSWWSATIPI